MRTKRKKHNRKRWALSLLLAVLIMPGVKPFAAAAEESQAEETTLEPVTETLQTEAGSVTATLGGISRKVSLKVAPREAVAYGDYADWAGVGAAQTEEDLKATGALEGSGTVEAPWKIGKPEALAWFMVKVNAGELTKDYQNVLLTADISLRGDGFGGSAATPLEWVPIASYSGTFDGGNHEIDYLYGEGAGKELGLINVMAGAVIQNVHIGANSSLNGNQAASIAVAATTGVNTMTNCSNKGAMTGIVHGAGLVCRVVEGGRLNISRCWNEGKIVGSNGLSGGLVGWYYSSSSAGSMITDCYNSGEIVCNTTDASGVSGIAGTYVYDSRVRAYIVNCYNVGIMSGKSNKFSITTNNSSGRFSNCFYYLSDGHSGSSSYAGATALTETQLKSWAAAYALNGQNMDGAWKYTEGQYPVFGELDPPNDWSVVGQGVIDGLITSSALAGDGTKDSPLQISTAEQMAVLAVRVNAGETSLCADLNADINLFGDPYSRVSYDAGEPDIVNKALRWVPIGSNVDGKRYTGTFNGNGYTISAMRAKDSQSQGLFGTLGNNASIKKTSISDIRIEVSGTGGGGIAGFVNGTGVTITECGLVGTFSGSGMFFGGCVGAASNMAEMTLDGCYNLGNIDITGGVSVGGIFGTTAEYTVPGHVTIRNSMNRGSVSGDLHIGGIVAYAKKGAVTIAGCYNAGVVSVAPTGDKGSIVGFYADVNDTDIRDCLIDKNYEYGTNVNCLVVERKALGTWGAAWRLNGGSLQQTTGLSWTYDKDSEYPILGATGLLSAESWEQVGEAVEYGLIKDKGKPSGDGNASSYQITAPEQLAWFAYQVNVPKEREIKAVLVNDIDMKAAEGSYISGGRLNWIPIGKDQLHMYQGAFESKDLSNTDDTHKIYRIQNLYASTEDAAGLFGYVMNGTITRIGLSNAQISGTSAGGIAGIFVGTSEAAQCYNRSESPGSGSVTASGNAGGIAGQVNGGVVRDCYNQETVIKGTEASSSAGGIAGSVLGTIRNSYSACGTAGSITAGGSTSAAGAVAGYPDGVMSQCYSDTGWSGDSVSMADSTYVSRLYATGNTELQKQAAGLNTVNGTQQMKENRIWYTSLESETTKGWPTLEPPVKMLSLGTVTPVDSSSGAAGEQLSLGSGVTISDAKVRDVSQETTGTQTVSLAEWKTEYYTSWGTINANGKIGLSGVGGTSAILKPDQMSLENPVQGLGTISGLKVYTGAACTYPTDRDILVELSSGSDRYEIRFTIKGVTSKSLVVDLPNGVAMADELMPDGTEKTAYSVDTAIQNRQNYPMEGKILKAVPISKTDIATYQALKPIAKTTNYGSGQIYEAGVRLGITNPKTGTEVISGDLYYNPDATGDTNPWMTCQLKAAGGTLPYRYFLKYKADPYYDSGHPNFGYNISYQFGVMADDYSAAAGAVAGQ